MGPSPILKFNNTGQRHDIELWFHLFEALKQLKKLVYLAPYEKIATYD